jgi:hypothetical protein
VAYVPVEQSSSVERRRSMHLLHNGQNPVREARMDRNDQSK